MLMWPRAPSNPVRKVIEEMWPSPVARRLRMNRNPPAGRSDWSGCGTIEGLNRPGTLKRILVVKISAEQELPFLGQLLAGGQAGADQFEASLEKLTRLGVTPAELLVHLLPKGVNFGFREEIGR